MERTGGRGKFEDPREMFSRQLAELEDPAKDVYFQIWDRIQEIISEGGNPTLYKKVVDLRSEKVQSLWTKISLATRSKRFSKLKEESLFRLLTIGIDLRIFSWKTDDRSSHSEQKQKIERIGRLASDLFRAIATAKPGYVSDFLRQWASCSPKREFSLDDFYRFSERNEWAASTWMLQYEIVRSNKVPQTLIYSLLSLSQAAQEYRIDRKNSPKSQIGLMSRKKSEHVLFVIRLHVELEKIFGKPSYGINSDLSSIVFSKSISEDRVVEIIERARQRGEIRSSKSPKSPGS